jgi:hypothetical protein
VYESWRVDPDDSTYEFLKQMSQFDEPAFIRRARRVAESWNQLLAQCRTARERLLTMSRLRLGQLGALVEHDWSAAAAQLRRASDAERLAEWSREWNPRLRCAVVPSKSPRKIRAAIDELACSVVRFNQRWQSYLDELDLRTINLQRQDYNNYYVLEKACAFRSERIAQAGFEPLPPVTVLQLRELFPPLPPPELR